MRHKAIPFLLAALLAPSFAHAQPGRAEQKRREILDKLGLDKAPSPPPAPVEEEPDEPAQVEAPATNVTAPQAAAPAAPPAPPSFRRQIHPWLNKACGGCHQKAGPAGTTAFVIGQGLATDHANTVRQVNTGSPARSALVLEATGHNHGGGTIAAPRSAEIRRLVAWIAAGAPLEDAAAGTAVAATPEASQPQPRRRTTRTTTAAGAETPAEAETETPVAEAPSEAAPEPKLPAATSTATTPAPPAFSEAVHGVLTASCQACHSSKGMASRSKFMLEGDVSRDYASTKLAVIAGDANTSPLLTKATGQAHMPVFDRASDAYRVIAAWINAGAHGPFPPEPAVQAEAEPQADAPQLASLPAPLPPPPPTAAPSAAHPHAAGYPGGLNLPLGLRLNGRFDMAYERRGLSNHPLASGQTQFQNYHHFLFLSRDETDDPVTFTVELVALTFWEAHLRVTPRQAPVQVRLKVGKLIVPFGAEPLFHQSYGGLQGFDQRVLPVFWAQNGFGARLNTNIQDVAVMADVYAVRGYALRDDGQVLNLQSHFSPNDDLRPSYGTRLNVSWRALSGYYSLIVNGLGMGRTLVMQALDFNMWRWHGVPVLDRMTFGFGFLRADVSGGGAGNDYYHFASYAQARFFICDSVFVQYRQGLRTFNNRRGLLQDNTRFTSDDGSAHNVGVVWRQRGLSVGAYQFWNLEKVNEIRDDFFRLMVAYEF